MSLCRSLDRALHHLYVARSYLSDLDGEDLRRIIDGAIREIEKVFRERCVYGET